MTQRIHLHVVGLVNTNGFSNYIYMATGVAEVLGGTNKMKKMTNGMTVMTNGRYREIVLEANIQNELEDAVVYEGHIYFLSEFQATGRLVGYDAIYQITEHYGIAIKYSELQDAIKVASFY